MGLATLLAFAGCGDDDGTADAGRDTGTADTGAADTGGADTGAADTGGADTGGADTGGADTGGADTGGADTGADTGGADTGDSDAGSGCETDSDCTVGDEWCVEGACVECDNSGLLCDIFCSPPGWTTYMRNGCSPCECAPPNQCTSDAECEGDSTCVAGEFCWDWCPEDDPSCCFGNTCVAPGCEGPPPVGCRQRGCAPGGTCEDFEVTGICVPSGCGCSDGAWICTSDCNGGSCSFLE